jgi:hypothetical protein
MMRKVSIAVMAGAMSALLGGSAWAQAFAPATNGAYALDQDTLGGAYSSWRVQDLSGMNALRARVTVARLGQDPKWSPVFSVFLKNNGGRAQLQLTALNGVLTAIASSWVGDKQKQTELFVLGPEPGEAFDLDVDWTAAGSVTFVIRDKANAKVNGFERHEVSMPGAPTTLEIGDSTGEWALDPLRLGHAGP